MSMAASAPEPSWPMAASRSTRRGRCARSSGGSASWCASGSRSACRVRNWPTASRPRRNVRGMSVCSCSGTFQDATEAYAADIRPYLRRGDEIVARTIEQLERDRPEGIGLVVAPRTLLMEAQTHFPGLPVVGITLIPNEATRIALAAISPQAQVAIVSYFPEFLPAMRAGILRFAPHVTRITSAVWRGREPRRGDPARRRGRSTPPAPKTCAPTCVLTRSPSSTATRRTATPSRPTCCRR